MAQRIRFAAASEHLTLRGEYFRKRPLHENDLIVAPFRDRQEKLGNNLHDLAFSFVDAIGLLGKKLGGFPLRVAPWVVGVRLAFGDASVRGPASSAEQGRGILARWVQRVGP